MARKTKTETTEKAKTAAPVEPQEATLPDFVFMGTDGEVYLVGQTPHSLIAKLLGKGLNATSFGYEQLDEWLFDHLRVVPDQRHLTLEMVRDLYFEIDVPQIFDFICRRIIEAKSSTAKAVDVLEKRSTQLLEILKGSDDGEKAGPAHKKRQKSRRLNPE